MTELSECVGAYNMDAKDLDALQTEKDVIERMCKATLKEKQIFEIFSEGLNDRETRKKSQKLSTRRRPRMV